MTNLNFPHGAQFYDPQANQRVPFAQLLFEFSPGSGALSMYQDAALTTLWTQPIVADANGNFPPNIYFDPFNVNAGHASITLSQSVAAGGAMIWRVPDYYVPFATSADSPVIRATTVAGAIIGEFAILAPPTGVVPLQIYNIPGSVALRLIGGGQSAGVTQPTWEVSNVITTGTHTATFTATNKPGNAASGPVKWLPILCNGVVYYTPCFA